MFNNLGLSSFRGQLNLNLKFEQNLISGFDKFEINCAGWSVGWSSGWMYREDLEIVPEVSWSLSSYQKSFCQYV